jgi:hypothetical protein
MLLKHVYNPWVVWEKGKGGEIGFGGSLDHKLLYCFSTPSRGHGDVLKALPKARQGYSLDIDLNVNLPFLLTEIGPNQRNRA